MRCLILCASLVKQIILLKKQNIIVNNVRNTFATRVKMPIENETLQRTTIFYLFEQHLPKASEVTQRLACNVYCSCNQNREVVVYCEDIDDVICDACATVKHRRCRTFSIQNKSRSYATKKLDSVIDKTKTLRM